MLWKTRKNTRQSSCPAPNSHDRDSTNIIQSHPCPLRHPTDQSIPSNTRPGKFLISRAPFLYLWNYKLRVMKSQVSQRQRGGNRLLMQTWFQCQPWRCPLLGNVWFIAFLITCREGKNLQNLLGAWITFHPAARRHSPSVTLLPPPAVKTWPGRVIERCASTNQRFICISVMDSIQRGETEPLAPAGAPRNSMYCFCFFL